MDECCEADQLSCKQDNWIEMFCNKTTDEVGTSVLRNCAEWDEDFLPLRAEADTA